MAIHKIRPNVFFLGVKDYDRRLFDELIPLPEGTTYNSYLIIGSEKTAIIDAVDPTKEEEWLSNIKKTDIQTVDYIISNHTEQDHAGGIVKLLELYPEAQVVTNEKGMDMLIHHLRIPKERFITKNDGESLSLGDKTLEFINAPWVHWPETMFTFLREDKILFTCDFLGSHLATSDFYVSDEHQFYDAAKRYYAEIMMPFRRQIKRHLQKLKEIDFDLVCPSHGPLQDNPEFLINAYSEWVSDKVENVVLLPYVSMHGSTKKMVEYMIDALIERGIKVKPFNLTVTDLGELASALVDAATIVIGTPAVLVGPHPSAVYATYLVNALRPKTRFASVIGSYGWGCKVTDTIIDMLPNLRDLEFLEPAHHRGLPTEEIYEDLDRLADEILQKHKEIGIIN